MLAPVLTLALLGIAIATIVQQLRRDGNKILAALRGQSWIATPPSPLVPVTVRITQRYPTTRPMRAAPKLVPADWRAAA